MRYTVTGVLAGHAPASAVRGTANPSRHGAGVRQIGGRATMDSVVAKVAAIGVVCCGCKMLLPI